MIKFDNVLSTVRTMGIDYAQGFALHKPEPILDLLHMYLEESGDFKKQNIQYAELG